jgi:hypothetical protein
MDTKLKFNLLGDPTLNPVLVESLEGVYEAPNTHQLIHRFYYDAGTDKVADAYVGKTDRQVQELNHAAAIALAEELGTQLPPPLPAV